MSKPYLEITYRNGKRFAAYLYLSRRSGDHTVRSVPRGSLVIDYASDGRCIGIEVPSVTLTAHTELRAALDELNRRDISIAESVPLKAG